jgi:hypothetical protein
MSNDVGPMPRRAESGLEIYDSNLSNNKNKAFETMAGRGWNIIPSANIAASV